MEEIGVVELIIALPREATNAPILSSIWATVAVLQPSLIFLISFIACIVIR